MNMPMNMPMNVPTNVTTEETDERLRIDIVSDVVCPWCVIGYHQLEAALRTTGIEADLHWHPFELNPGMAAGGENLREHLAAKYGTTPEGSRRARARLTAIGAELGFRFRYADDMRIYDTNAAHRLIHWARSLGRAHETEMALFAAFFTDRRAIDEEDVLVDVAAGVGLDPEDAARARASPAVAEEVRAAERYWISSGIRGVPAMVLDRRHLVTGAQGVESFSRTLRAMRRSEPA